MSYVPAPRMTTDVVPSSYEELFKVYYSYVVRLVISRGIDPEGAEDVAMSILATFYEKDVLSDYDPDRTMTYGGTEHRAVFRTFLSGFVSTYVLHYRDRQNKHQYREGLSMDTPMTTNDNVALGGNDPGGWADILIPAVENQHDVAELVDTVGRIRRHLATIPPVNSQDKCDLSAFFEKVIELALLDGKLSIETLAEYFEVSKNSIQSWLRRLRKEIALITAKGI